MWGRCSEHLLRENKNTNTNPISLIHLSIGTYFISRHPDWSHESPHLLAGSQCCSSCFHDNPDASLLQSLPIKVFIQKQTRGTASQVVTQENALKCSYKIADLLKTQLGNSQSITGAISATGHGWTSWVPLSGSKLSLCRLLLFSWQLMQRKGHF